MLTFEQWLEQNPKIWAEFCKLADEMRAKRPRWSARAILHVLRWQRAMRDCTDPDYKINNNWSAQMARKYNAERGVPFFQERESE